MENQMTRTIRTSFLLLIGGALLIFGSAYPAPSQTQPNDKLHTPAEGRPERQAILDAVRDEYKEGDDHPTQFKVNYLKVHNGWAWIDVTPLSAGGDPVGDPAPLLFYNDQGKWASKDLIDVGLEGDEHEGPHDPT